MNSTLEHYRQVHNDLRTAIENEPAGDVKANIVRIADRMRDEIIRASNLIDDGKSADKVFERIDKLFNKL
jgi:hypothetical protein